MLNKLRTEVLLFRGLQFAALVYFYRYREEAHRLLRDRVGAKRYFELRVNRNKEWMSIHNIKTVCPAKCSKSLSLSTKNVAGSMDNIEERTRYS